MLVGKVLEKSGCYDVKRVGGSGDLGVDLLALNGQGRLLAVQCKRYAPGNSVGSPDIQKFIGMAFIHHKAKRGIFVTTSFYTQPAIELAKNHAQDHPILLIDGNQLVDIAKDHFAP